ncbi:hypothetical protein WICPIJ_008493 [Wickerhamomyces pijperi]|uniref:Ubiquitin-like domain-containing protein n=1 Tax=Wickerhamomyces pijperi TaxID=599730 RepID=A0A9P8TI98_WICPI|nr:hypothetical protein WICPIJ_008493 [Wickerhamomyces pijperi]
MNPRDIAYRLPSIGFNIQCWSSTPHLFPLRNKLIRATLENTVADVKEFITLRTNREQQESDTDSGVLLNPECIALIYRNVTYRDEVQLGDFINKNDDDPIRIQVEINKSLLSYKDTLPSLIDLNVKLASGKCLHYRESLEFSLSSLKFAIKEDLSFANDEQITSINYLDGVELKDETMPLSELLNTDMVPSDAELNLYAVLQQDFPIRLSSPTPTGTLQRSEVYVNSDTTVLTIKKFILDQYKGGNILELEGIRVIYFGRILSNEQQIKDIITASPSDSGVNQVVTFHFVLNERPEASNALNQNPNSFWSDLREGRLFEFLPREPNPNFEEEVRRDRIAREMSRTGSLSGPTGTPPTGQQQEQEQGQVDPHLVPSSSTLERERNLSYTSVASTYNSQAGTAAPTPNIIRQTKPMFLSNSQTSVLTGDTQEIMTNPSDPFQTITVDQTLTSSEVYTIKINAGTSNEQSVTLGTSQCQVNNTDPANPYVMLSPSGVAKLQSLGIELDLPELEIVEDDDSDTLMENSRLRERTDWIYEQARIIHERVYSDNNNDPANIRQRMLQEFEQVQQNLELADQLNQGQGIHQPQLGVQAAAGAAAAGNAQARRGGVLEFELNFNMNFVFMLGKVGFFYYMFSSSLPPNSTWLHGLLIFGCIVFILTRAPVRPLVRSVYQRILHENVRGVLEQRFNTIYGVFFREFEELVGLYRSLLSFVDNIQNPLLRLLAYASMDVVLFFTSFIPHQYAAFAAAAERERLAKLEAQARAQAQAQAQVPEEEVGGSVAVQRGEGLGVQGDHSTDEIAINAIGEPVSLPEIAEEQAEVEREQGQSYEEEPIVEELIQEEQGASGESMKRNL